MGATRWEAFQPIAREALRKAMLPTINQMSIIGLISIPGMMTGQLIAGASVLNAAKSQMIIMYMISSASAFGTLGAIWLCFSICFDKNHRLRPERVVRNESLLPKSVHNFPDKVWVTLRRYLCCCFADESAESFERGQQEQEQGQQHLNGHHTALQNGRYRRDDPGTTSDVTERTPLLTSNNNK
ncbi:hypothetical protein BGZ73_003738 [Actinomortierella ambigua]|nr:hypothetical protein BGZ73_003738 [Actinomortierella ambigua]